MAPNSVIKNSDVPLKPAIVCLVEDNPMDAELTVQAFSEVNIANRLIVIENGEDALEYFFGRGKYTDRETYPLPDLVLLDIKLPKVDGHEILRQIKAEPGLRRIPVIMLTGSKQEEDLLRSYDRHANSFLQKPVTYEGFCRVVAEIEDYWFTLNVATSAHIQ